MTPDDKARGDIGVSMSDLAWEHHKAYVKWLWDAVDKAVIGSLIGGGSSNSTKRKQ